MNDPIEDALHRLKPADLPPALMARLTAARPQEKSAAEEAPVQASGMAAVLAFARRWLLPAGVSAVAAIVTVTWLNLQNPAQPPVRELIADNPSSTKITRPPGLDGRPFERENRLVNAREVGVVMGPDRRPMRLMEVEWTEAETVRPQDGGNGVRVETTRRGVVPVAIEFY